MERARLVLIFLLFATPAFGASDGSLGRTSSGSSNITLNIPAKIKISGVTDLDLGTYIGGGTNLFKGSNVCVYTNNTSGRYRVTLSGNGAGNSFALTNSLDAATIPYTVAWNDSASPSGATNVSSGVPLSGRTGANTASQTCAGQSNAYFQASVPANNARTAHSGLYSGRLTIFVEPE